MGKLRDECVIPLVALVDFCGFRLVALSFVPSPSNLVLGFVVVGVVIVVVLILVLVVVVISVDELFGFGTFAPDPLIVSISYLPSLLTNRMNEQNEVVCKNDSIYSTLQLVNSFLGNYLHPSGSFNQYICPSQGFSIYRPAEGSFKVFFSFFSIFFFFTHSFHLFLPSPSSIFWLDQKRHYQQ